MSVDCRDSGIEQNEAALIMALENELPKTVATMCSTEAGTIFRGKDPFPWMVYEDLFSREVYRRLQTDFPPLSAFRKDEGRPRQSQRPHDRYYLTLSDYPRKSGEIGSRELPAIWRSLVDIFLSEGYLRFASAMLGEAPDKIRLAWHMSHRGSEVSPHTDSKKKLGTQIFYFNDGEDWNPDWGGDTLLLSRPTIASEGPDFNQFEWELQINQLAHQSLFFMRTDTSWHGLRRLSCPMGKYRKTFHVIFEKSRA